MRKRLHLIHPKSSIVDVASNYFRHKTSRVQLEPYERHVTPAGQVNALQSHHIQRHRCSCKQDQINTQGRNKRAAARKQKADEALMEHLRNPPPIFPGSNIASITDIAGFANQTKAENELKDMREDQDVTGDGFRTAGKDSGAKDGFTTTQSVSRTKEQPKAAFAWGSLSISARPSIDPDAQS